MNKQRFLWGVATSAYQSEGGYNGPGQPQTNWAAAERAGEVALTGKASEFWTRYKADFATCRKMGLNAFRLGIEWSRAQPSVPGASVDVPPPFDERALDHYADMIAEARSNGLEPVVTLHHFVHPDWLGTDPWLAGDVAVELFAEFVRTTVQHVNQRITSRYDVEPVRYYITINEPNMLVVNSYLAGQLPIGRDAPEGLEPMLRAYDALVAAHVAAYNIVHDLYAENAWETPAVTLNTYCSDVYWLDKFLLDLLCLRERGIGSGEEAGYLREKAKEFQRAIKTAALPFKRDLPFLVGSLARKITNLVGIRVFREVRMPQALAAIRRSPRATLLDYVALDYYDPFFAHLARLPTRRDLEWKSKTPQSAIMAAVTSKWWDWRVLPAGLEFFCRYYSSDLDNRPVMIAENGMAIRCTMDHVGYPRRDGISRSEFLQRHVASVVETVRAEVPLFGYLHWSLFDNYEWGSFSPRFGLFALDYRAGTDRLLTDCSGDNAAETYATLIKQAREVLLDDVPQRARENEDELRQVAV